LEIPAYRAAYFFLKFCGYSAPLAATAWPLVVKRRNLSAGQRAVAAAEAWSQAAAEGRVQTGQGGDHKSKPKEGVDLIQSPRDSFAGLFGVGKNYVEMARALWLDDPPAGDAVKAGTADLTLMSAAIGRLKPKPWRAMPYDMGISHV
jgi:hypothetical protein